jgi:gluconokinase
MGVSGSGKTTIARALAQRLRWSFAEGDEFHPASNVAKMRAGVALTDEDRWPWLDAIAAWIRETRARGESCVVACSALKRAYRERIAAGRDDACFVFLQGDPDTIAGRLERRTGHYMPLSLLQSQFATLEVPAEDEWHIVVPVDDDPADMVGRILSTLGLPAL